MAIEAGKKMQGFADSEFLGEPSFLQRDAEQFAKFALIALPVAAENCNFAGCGIEQAFQNFDGRGLAGTVRAEQTETFASLDFEIQAADRFDFTVVGLT